MKPFYEIVRRPLVTEKSMLERSRAVYAFEVARAATKGMIRAAIQDFFKVTVSAVRTVSVPGKRRRIGRHVGKAADWKKAIVTLKPGQKIDLLEAE